LAEQGPPLDGERDPPLCDRWAFLKKRRKESTVWRISSAKVTASRAVPFRTLLARYLTLVKWSEESRTWKKKVVGVVVYLLLALPCRLVAHSWVCG
jgi:hypothetical protein